MPQKKPSSVSTSPKINNNQLLFIVGGLILLAIGILIPEVIKRNAAVEAQKYAAEQQVLQSETPAILDAAIDNLLSSPNLSFTSEVTENVYGCQFGYTYTGQYSTEKQYAKVETFKNNHALIKEICTSSALDQLESLEGEAYWEGDKKYARSAKMLTFSEDDWRNNLSEPRAYLTKYFSAYDFDRTITAVTKAGDTLKIELDIKSGTEQFRYLVELDYPSKSITSISITPQETTTGKTEKLLIKYGEPEIKLSSQVNRLDPALIRQVLDAPETEYSVSYDTLSIRKSSASKLLYLSKQVESGSTDDGLQSCKLQVQSCVDQLYAINALLQNYLSNFVNTQGKDCPVLLANSTSKPNPTVTTAPSDDTFTITLNDPNYYYSDKYNLTVTTNTRSGEVEIQENSRQHCYSEQLDRQVINDTIQSLQSINLD